MGRESCCWKIHLSVRTGRMSRITPALFAAWIFASGLVPAEEEPVSITPAESKPVAEEWFPLFNATNLDGWTIKIAKRPLGENYANTFRVEDGMIKVSYDDYPKFDGGATFFL